MTDSLNPLSVFDRPEINSLIFYPRPDFSGKGYFETIARFANSLKPRGKP